VKDCANIDAADPIAITVGQLLDRTLLFSATRTRLVQDFLAGRPGQVGP
jgi:hypothetical protein